MLLCGNKECGVPFTPMWRFQRYCNKKCRHRSQEQRHRLHNPERARVRDRRKHSRRHLEKLELRYRHLIASGCSRCSERRPSALQYHHLDPAMKKKEIGEMVAGARYTISALKEEMSKCIVLCANCHFVEENDDGYRSEDRPV